MKLLQGMTVLLVAALVIWLTTSVRTGKVPSKVVRVLAPLTLLLLVALVVSDFPGPLSSFWSAHSVLAAMISSLLLVGAAYFAYEYREQSRQEELSVRLSGAGLGGLVDHMIDVEVALALAALPKPPNESNSAWTGWDNPSRPLRWLRKDRNSLNAARDPRFLKSQPGATPYEWTEPLIDQSIRRLLAGMRDWSPLIDTSTLGTEVLICLSDIRVSLMEVKHRVAVDKGDTAWVGDLISIRSRCRVLALCFETWSGARMPRHTLVTGMQGPWVRPHLPSTASSALRARFEESVRRIEHAGVCRENR